MQIAIDGPSGAGKSTIAKELSNRLNYEYLDTGAMYRALAFEFRDKNFIEYDNDIKLKNFLDTIVMNVENNLIYINGKNLSSYLRDERIGMLASKISSYPLVRKYLVDIQRQIADGKNIILDGRDVGTVILPNSECKIFLNADINERARRRFEQLKSMGKSVDFDMVLEDIKKRDYDDAHRKHSPLKKADDAYEVDCTNLTIEETVELIIEVISECGGN